MCDFAASVSIISNGFRPAQAGGRRCADDVKMKKDNNQSKKGKKFCTKVSLIIFLLFFLFFVIALTIGILFGFEKAAPYFWASLVLSCISGIVFLGFAAASSYYRTISKAEFDIPFTSFEELLYYIRPSLIKNKYREINAVCPADYEDVKIFYRKKSRSKSYFFALVKVSELAENDDIDWISGAVKRAALKALKGVDDDVYPLWSIYVVCAERLTPSLERMTNGSIPQRGENVNLPCGISFEDKRLYSPPLKRTYAAVNKREAEASGFGYSDYEWHRAYGAQDIIVGSYKRMRKELCRIMGFDAKEHGKNDGGADEVE